MNTIMKTGVTGIVAAIFITISASADYYWDTIAGNSQVDGGNGIWDSGSNWTTDGGTNNVSWSDGQIVRLQATPGTITINGSVSPGNPVYIHTNGYVITGGVMANLFTYFRPDANVLVRIQSSISGGNNVGISGSGTTVLAGNNTGKTGGLWNMESSLLVAHDNALGNGSLFFNGGNIASDAPRTFTNSFSGESLRFNGAPNMTFTAGYNFGLGNATLQNFGAGLPLLAGKISGGDALSDNINVNAGRVGMTNAANDYTGTVQLPSVLFAGNNAAGLSANANLRFTGGLLEAGGTFNRTLGSGVGQVQWSSGFSGGFAACGSKLTVDLESSGVRDTLTWSGFFVPAGPGTLTLGSSTADNEVEFYDNLNMQGSGRTITVNDNPNTPADRAVVSGVISGDSGIGVGKAGLGLLVLTGANNYPGVTSLSKGCLRADFGAGIPSGSYIQFGNAVGAEPAIWESSGTQTRTIQTTAGSVFWNGSHGGFAAVGGPFILDLEAVGYTLDWSATWDGFGGAVLQLNSPNATDVVTINNNINFKGDRTVQVFDNSFTNTDKAVMLGVLANGDTTPRNFTKSGPGILELAGASTYSGTTAVNGGTLRVNGSLGSGGGTVTVASGAALGGTGTIARAVTVLGGGILAPGTSVGTLTVSGNVTLSNNVVYAWEHNGASGDKVAIAGDLNLPANATIVCTNIAGGTAFPDPGVLFTFTTRSGAGDLGGWTVSNAPAGYGLRLTGNSMILGKGHNLGTVITVQ